MRNISIMYQIIDNKLHKLVWVLDEEDFRVNSEWWEISSKNNNLLISPCWWIIEEMEWINKWKQFFIKSAMIRELNKAWKVLANRGDLISWREYNNYTNRYYHLNSFLFFDLFIGTILHLNREIFKKNIAFYYNNSSSHRNEWGYVSEVNDYYFAVRCISYNL